MKKILTTVLTAATVVMMAFASVFAAGSSTGLVELGTATDSNGNPINYVDGQTDIPLISPEVAASLAGTESAEMTVVWQRNITATALPATFTFTVNGTAGQMLYVYHYNGSAWELISSGVGPTVTATFTSLSPVAIVRKSVNTTAPVAPATEPAADSATEPVADPATTSPATGSSVLVMAIATLAVAGSAAYVVATKKEA